MNYGRKVTAHIVLLMIVLAAISGMGCNTTKYLKDSQYLLRSNNIKLKSDQPITRKGELKDNLEALVVQKPNSYILGTIPFKLWLYNSRYEKYQKDTSHFQLKSKMVEPPVIYDSSSMQKSALNMRGYLFHEGYFYSKVTDTTIFKKQKAYVTYRVETGTNYLINKVHYDVQDNTINSFITMSSAQTLLKKNAEFTYGLLEEERSRITAYMRNYGFYKFSNDNINFILDTLNKQYLKDVENPFESAINFIALQKEQKKPTLDIQVIIRADEDSSAFFRYGINRIRVFPDFRGRADYRDSTMIEKKVAGVIFRYRPEDYYIRENVIVRHMFLEPEKYFSQSDYDLTITRLNELGVFQTVRITFTEDTTRTDHWLNCNVYLNPAKKFDFNTTVEGSNGTNYQVGTALTVTGRDHNLGKGANLLTTSISGGVEFRYSDTIGNSFLKDFALQTRNASITSSIDFPKFLGPFGNSFSRRNTPRTIVSAGINLLERVNYFTLINTAANFSYRWNETSTKTWEFAPAFVNVIRTPYLSPAFKNRLDSNAFLRNTYKETFIEGENLAFIFTDREKRSGRDYSYARIALEEAGGLLKGINALTSSLDSQYSQYLKVDFDAQHFFVRRHSTIAFRFYGGIGAPYDNSRTLPYIKQYFVGGAYSMRGYRIRRLGPGSFYDTSQNIVQNIIDLTGDIKLELNGEYRFDMVQLFSGAVNLKGALFADAGNIWLYNKASKYDKGEFAFNKLGDDVAVCAGLGLRFDIAGFFLVRVDVGMPLKNPDYPSYAPIPGGWVIDKIDFGSPAWRKQNIIPQFAVGYPF